MRARWVVVAIAAACGKEPAKPTPTPPAPARSVENVGPVPITVLDRFGDSDTVFAIDPNAIWKGRAGALFPHTPCAQHVLASVGVTVFALGSTVEGFVSNVPEQDAKVCMPHFGQLFGFTAQGEGSAYELVGDSHYSLTWVGTTLHVVKVGAPGHGKLSPELRALMEKVPKDAVFWSVSMLLLDHFPKTTVWATLEDPNIHVTITTGGTAAQTKELFDTVEDTLRGMAAKKQAAYDPAWVKVSGQTLDVRMPLATLAALRED